MSEICWSGAAIICASRLLSRCISSFSFAIFSLCRMVFVVLALLNLALLQTGVFGSPQIDQQPLPASARTLPLPLVPPI